MVSEVAEQETEVDFYYVDVDPNAELANKFGIRSIPTLIRIENGNETDRSIGFISEKDVKAFAHGK